MISKLYNMKLTHWMVCFAVGICGCAGHSPDDYKTEADERVYNIIDKKWQAAFGSKTNYKISDTSPSPNDIKIEKAIPASGVLTLSQAVTMATAHNRRYQSEKEALYIKALDLRLTRHEFENQFFSGASGGYAKDGDDEAVGAEANLGFNRLLAGGARISMNVGAAWVDVLTGDLHGGLASVLSATVTQPLLRGSDRKIVQENLTQAERDTLYQIRAFNRFRKTFVVSVISQYYRALQQFDILKNTEDNYNTFLDVYERAKKLANAGRLPRFELDQAHQDKLQAQDIYVRAQKEYKQALDEFKITLSLPTSVELVLDENELEILIEAGLSVPDFSEADIIDTALHQRLDLANSADAIADAKRKVLVAADSLRAELNLIAGTDLTSDDTADLSRLKPLGDSSAIGMELDLPFDRVREQNVYRKALISLTQRQRDYEEASDVVTLEVRQAYRDLTEATDRHRVQLENLALARKRFKNTLSLLQYRRANTRDVLDAQEDLFDAQNEAMDALVDYTVATLNFYRDSGVLQVQPDGMWQRL